VGQSSNLKNDVLCYPLDDLLRSMFMTTRHNKLVRDKIVDLIRAKGEEAKAHIATEDEYGQKLLEKLSEEVGEFIRDQNEEEIADIQEVIDAIIDFKGFDRNTIDRIKREKTNKKGKFEQRIILEES
jgi:predicted house-cleaning noncanonical NTP pyrophosphatase (MazG superfamily)